MGCLVGKNLWRGVIDLCCEMRVIRVNYGGMGLKLSDCAFVSVGLGVG